jgi:hypothetical protein
MNSLTPSIALAVAIYSGAADAQDTSGLTAEPQVAIGKFLTATEVKPILNATQSNWVAVREFNGQDLVYVTHLWAWRCGLAQMELAINEGDYEVWDMPECHADEGSPGAIKSGDGDPYRSFELGSVQTIKVRLVYDDLTTAEAAFERASIMTP